MLRWHESFLHKGSLIPKTLCGSQLNKSHYAEQTFVQTCMWERGWLRSAHLYWTPICRKQFGFLVLIGKQLINLSLGQNYGSPVPFKILILLTFLSPKFLVSWYSNRLQIKLKHNSFLRGSITLELCSLVLVSFLLCSPCPPPPVSWWLFFSFFSCSSFKLYFPVP